MSWDSLTKKLMSYHLAKPVGGINPAMIAMYEQKVDIVKFTIEKTYVINNFAILGKTEKGERYFDIPSFGSEFGDSIDNIRVVGGKATLILSGLEFATVIPLHLPLMCIPYAGAKIRVYVKPDTAEVKFQCDSELVSSQYRDTIIKTCGMKDRKSTRLNSSHSQQSRMPSSA